MCRKHYDTLILDHYKKVAENFGDSSSSTMQDVYVRDKEIEFIIEEVKRVYFEQKKELTILDVGCGNGYTLSVLKKYFSNFKMYGVEFSPELYEIAKSREIPEVEFFHSDIRNNNFFNKQVDIVITERVIINILNKKHQECALYNLISKLPDGGTYIMIESFTESLSELNQARDEMALDPVDESYQNKYLNEFIIKKLRKFGLIEITPTMPSNYLSSHFFTTRVLHEVIKPAGSKIKFNKMVGFLDKAFPPAIGNFSPILFRVFRKMN